MNQRSHFRRIGAAMLLFHLALVCACHRAVITPAADSAGAVVAATCSLEASAAVAHAGDVLKIHANAAFPSHFALIYYWTLAGGTLKGNGADMVWRPKDAAPGMYVIRARVEDGHGMEAACSVEVEVAEGAAR
jgi:hypothetical protein